MKYVAFKTLPTVFKSLRTNKNMSTQELATKLNITEKHLLNIENEKAVISTDMIRRYAEVFNLFATINLTEDQDVPVEKKKESTLLTITAAVACVVGICLFVIISTNPSFFSTLLN